MPSWQTLLYAAVTVNYSWHSLPKMCEIATHSSSKSASMRRFLIKYNLWNIDVRVRGILDGLCGSEPDKMHKVKCARR